MASQLSRIFLLDNKERVCRAENVRCVSGSVAVGHLHQVFLRYIDFGVKTDEWKAMRFWSRVHSFGPNVTH